MNVIRTIFASLALAATAAAFAGTEATARAEAAEAALQAELATAEAARKADAQRRTAERRAADDAARTETAAIERAADQAQQRAESQHQARLKRLQTECGAEFQQPRVGMTLDRARQCVGDLALVSQLNRADGVASVYRAGPLFVTVLQGRVVAWANSAPPPR